MKNKDRFVVFDSETKKLYVVESKDADSAVDSICLFLAKPGSDGDELYVAKIPPLVDGRVEIKDLPL